MPTALRFVLCESSVALGTVLGSLAPHTHISKEGCQDKFQVNLYSPTLGISKSNRHSSMLWKRWNWLFYIRFFPENYTGTSPSLHPAPKKGEARAGPALSVFTTARWRDEFTAELRLVCQR